MERTRGRWPTIASFRAPRRGALLALALVGCAATQTPQQAEGPRLALPQGAAAVSAGAAGDTLIAALGPMGMLVADPNGGWTSRYTGEEVTAGAGVALANGRVLYAAADEARGLIKLSAADRGAIPKEPAVTVSAPYAPRHLCFDPAGFLFVGDSAGLVHHYRVLLDRDGRSPEGLRLVRSILFGGPTAACGVSAERSLVVLEAGAGLWRMPADAERLGRRARIEAGETAFAGIAAGGPELLAYEADGAVWRLPDAEAPVRLGRLPLAEETLVGAGVIGADVIGVGADGALARLAVPSATVRAPPRVVLVPAAAETEPVPDAGDAADDPALWRHPSDPSQSLILGANKQSGLEVYDLTGARRQRLKLGRINNVDVRQNLRLEGGARLDVAAATDVGAKAIQLFVLDRENGQVSTLAAFPAQLETPYGLCLHADGQAGAVQVIATGSQGEVRQWRVRFTPQGVFAGADLVREGRLSSVAEGCVADDAAGALYLAEERVGLWRLPADPKEPLDTRTLVDAVKPKGKLTADVEGVAVMPGKGALEGYLVVSAQGADAFLVYDRAPPHAYRGTFEVGADVAAQIDGASETDGIEIAAGAFGPDYPEGLLVVQDGRNVEPAEAQNFKLVSWTAVKAALGLE